MFVNIISRIVLPIVILILMVKIINSKKFDLETPIKIFMLFVPIAWLGYGIYMTLYSLIG